MKTGRCQRCAGDANPRGLFCNSCSAMVNRIIRRAVDGDIDDQELAEMVGISVAVLHKRRERMRRREARAA